MPWNLLGANTWVPHASNGQPILLLSVEARASLTGPSAYGPSSSRRHPRAAAHHAEPSWPEACHEVAGDVCTPRKAVLFKTLRMTFVKAEAPQLPVAGLSSVVYIYI